MPDRAVLAQEAIAIRQWLIANGHHPGLVNGWHLGQMEDVRELMHEVHNITPAEYRRGHR